jgi:hypothetical protein
LSERARQVPALVAEGRSNSAIAQQLVVGLRTVDHAPRGSLPSSDSSPNPTPSAASLQPSSTCGTGDVRRDPTSTGAANRPAPLDH